MGLVGEVTLAPLGPADGCVPSGSWNAGWRPAWPCTLIPQGRTRWLWEVGAVLRASRVGRVRRWVGGPRGASQDTREGVGCLEDKGGNIDFRD